ncbi:aldehyde ferredoxin oxidoreductase N-terminal domain-containing protein [Gordonibacter urolithinfaciens]|uniref:aldehyde ferredoxin oxidoreductase N-terminal domain-containing protein n=1 Tax=Gordonibacter urolithinfaciens TaxID=1335613 RepID=UPI00236866C4|nr:aldehyde ferredoxin oxidoreductase N-terminal domain-containing protein [Gordonibacter urolithinfaciens]
MTEHYGYAGKILIVNLDDRTSETIDTDPYIEWVGGHGMASKLFWDYCEDKTVEAVDPKNVLVFATTPFSGAVVPAASARCEFTGISPFSLSEWYNRSSMGGRLAGMMKEAGFDACVVRGKADAPVWISVVNDQVTFNDATDLWGLDAFECQERIWDEVTHGTPQGSWYELTGSRDGGRTTQRPSVICIGPAGENLARVSCIVHDAGHVTGQSGFGAVFGAKNLKAMSFIGSKSIPIADPAALVRLRLEVQQKFGYDIDAGKVPGAPGSPGAAFTVLDTSPTVSRAEGCRECFKNCRNLYPGGVGNELTCSAGLYFTDSGKIDEQLAAYSPLSKLGLNGYEIDMPVYLHNLYKMGVMGKGKDIDTDLPFEKYGTYAFIEELLMRIAYRREIGDDLAEGIARAAQKGGGAGTRTRPRACSRVRTGATASTTSHAPRWSGATAASSASATSTSTACTTRCTTPPSWRCSPVPSRPCRPRTWPSSWPTNPASATRCASTGARRASTPTRACARSTGTAPTGASGCNRSACATGCGRTSSAASTPPKRARPTAPRPSTR